jgi:predicted  nucleic acid-binding Zn-ribbon protein
MIGKNKKVIASVLAVAVLATAIPITAMAVETDSTSTSTVTESSSGNLAVRDITLKQLLYIPEDSEESNWDDVFVKQMSTVDETTFGSDFSKDDYMDIVESVANIMPSYKDVIMNLYNSDDTTVSVSLKDGVFTITADAVNLNAIVNEKINEQIEAAAGEYADKFGELEINTKLDTTAVLTIDTNTVKDDGKKITASFQAVCDGETYDVLGLFDLAGAKLDSIKKEFDDFFEKNYNDANEQLEEAKGKLKEANTQKKSADADITSAKIEIGEAWQKLNDAKAQGADTTKEEADLAASESKLADAEERLADADAKLKDADNQIADAQSKLDTAEEKATSVSAKFNQYINKIDSMKQSAENALTITSNGSGSNADEAYTSFYNAIMDKNIPQAIKNRIPSTLDGALNSEAFADVLSFMNNITVDEVSAVVKTAENVEMGIKDGKFTIVGDITDEQGLKEVTIEVDASKLESESSAVFYFNVKMLKRAEVTTTSETTPVSDVTGGDTTTIGSDITGSDTTTGSDVTGGDTTGSDVTGGDTTGSDVTGGDTTGSDVTTSETTPVSDVTGGDTTTNNGGKSLWDLAMEDESGKYRAGVLGDISLDYDVKAETPIELSDAITSYDALLALQNTVGSINLAEIPTVIGDVDFDGEITSYDALCILQYVVGSIDEYKDNAASGYALYVAVELDDGLDTVLSREYYRKDMKVSPIKYNKFSFDK